jgi:cysteine-rich repeat protein
MSTSTKVSPSRSVFCALVLAVAGAGVSACSDNTIPDVPDTGPGHDGSVGDSGVRDSAVDTGPPRDTGPTTPDTGPAPDMGIDTPDTGTDAAVGPTCGNGALDTGETCDTAITSGAGACPTSCDDTVACTTDAMTGSACTAECTHTPLTASGTTVDGCCPTGATHTTDTDCPASCGNGTVDAGETCDTGIASGAGACPTSCDDAMACTTDALVSGATCNAMCTHTTITTPASGDSCCPAGANHNTDTDCAAMCGNAVVEGPGETCEPPNTATCDSACHTITFTGCGDGVLQTGEQCDDGDRYNLDGCDSACNYETVARITDLDIKQGMAPAMCVHRTNRFGAAINGLALGTLNTALSDGISAGTTNILIDILGLDDLTGAADTAFTMGVVGAACDPAGGACPRMGNPRDGWFIVNHTGLDTMGHSTSTIMGALAGRALTTSGSPTVSFPFTLGTSSLLLTMDNVHVIAATGTATSRPAPPPASLRAGLMVFETIGGAGGGQGICGDVSVASLAAIPVPDILAMGGTNACGACGGAGARTYTSCGTGPVTPACNTLLDVFVGGCQVSNIICVQAIMPTQPDVAVTGTPRTLTLGTGNHVMASQLAGNTDSYSSWFSFTANRVHATGENCAAATDCQTGQACSTTGICM